MTLALAFACEDGLVVSADSEVTTDVERLDGDKVWYLRFPRDAEEPTLKVGIAGAGDLGFIKFAKDQIAAELQPDMDLDDTQAIIQGVINDLHHQHIYPYGQPHEREHLSVWLLIGILAKDGRRLLSTQLTSVTEVDRCHVIGTGIDLANFIVKRSGPERLTVADAVFLSSQVLTYARVHVRDVGGDSKIIVMQDVGVRAGFVSSMDIAKHEEFVQKIR